MSKKQKIILGIGISIILIIAIIGTIFIINKSISNRDYEIEKITSWNYFNLYKDGKVGVINNKGEIIVNPEYDAIQIPNPTKAVFVCIKDNETIIVNDKTQKIFTEYEEVSDIKLKELAIEIPYEKSVLKYKKDNKYGLINFEGKKVTNAIYDSLENLPYKEGEFLVQKDGKYGVINMLGRKVINNEYDEINIDLYYEEDINYKNSGYIVGNNTENGIEYNYINYKGEQLNKEPYKKIERVTEIENKDEVYLIYEKDNKYGVIKNNEEILKNEYDSIEYDSLNKLFVIIKENKYGIADIEGRILISNLYDYMDIEGIYIYAQKDGQQIVFDNKGEKKDNIQYKSAYWSTDLKYKIVINNENKYGVENTNGEKIIENKYSYIEYLNNDYFIVSGLDGKNGVIDNSGKIILELKYDSIEKLENSDLIQTYINDIDTLYLYKANMEKISEIKSGKIYEGENYIKLYSNNEAKYYNINGEEKQNKEILINNNIFADYKQGKWGFIDKQGNVKVDYIYDEITEFNQYGFAGIKKDGKWGSIDSQGNIIVEPVYTLTSNSNDINFIGKYYKYIYGYKKFYYTDSIKE